MSFEPVLNRLEALIARVEALVVPSAPDVDWSANAFRWRALAAGAGQPQKGHLQAVKHPHRIDLSALVNVETQKSLIVSNTYQFLNNKPANNVLLTGARGTGKSTLIKACWNEFVNQGLKLVEIDRTDLHLLLELIDLLADREEKFIVFCDDLSFEEGDASYKALKSALDGSIAMPPNNILFYATSNRRHLLPEKMRENLDVSYEDGEVRPNDSTEEKVSLSERFGLWLSFYPFTQDDYLAACAYWVKALGGTWNTDVEDQALLWHRTRGARSGRIAWQFAKDLVGKL